MGYIQRTLAMLLPQMERESEKSLGQKWMSPISPEAFSEPPPQHSLILNTSRQGVVTNMPNGTAQRVWDPISGAKPKLCCFDLDAELVVSVPSPC